MWKNEKMKISTFEYKNETRLWTNVRVLLSAPHQFSSFTPPDWILIS